MAIGARMTGAAEDGSKADYRHWPAVRAMLLAHPHWVSSDGELLAALNLRPAAANLVEFGPAALARLETAKAAERSAREEIEALAEANYEAQTASHHAVVDLLEARSAVDLAARVDAAARTRFGLAGATIGVQHAEAPVGWRPLPPGLLDQLFGAGETRFGAPIALGPLFGENSGVRSLALVRMRLWANAPSGARAGVLAFGSLDPRGFTADMGGELVTFLARVVAHTAERWAPRT